MHGLGRGKINFRVKWIKIYRCTRLTRFTNQISQLKFRELMTITFSSTLFINATEIKRAQIVVDYILTFEQLLIFIEY